MRLTLSLLLVLLSLSAFSQTVSISGRCYYDVNGNQVFDGTDSVLANRQLYASSLSASYQSTTNALGIYAFTVSVGSYTINYAGSLDITNYKNDIYRARNYVAGGADVVDFAFQKRDSIETIISYVEAANDNNIPNTGANRRFKIKYGYQGRLPTIPATVRLNFNPKLTLSNISPSPSVSNSGSLEWNFSSVQSNLFPTPFDSISFRVNFPATGDTIGAFLIGSKFIPGVSVSSPYTDNSATDFFQYIDFPAAQPVGPTNGVKWLRHFPGPVFGYEYDECRSVDTTQDGDGYFIAGNWASQSDSNLFARSRPFIARLNKDGLSVWEKFLDSLPGGQSFDRLTTIKHTHDGGCIVMGTLIIHDSTGQYNNKVLVARFNSSGNFTWSKAISGSRFAEFGQDLIVLADGSSLITGDASSSDGDFLHNNADTVYSNLFVTKLSTGGNILFTKVYGGAKNDYGYRIQPISNGNFLVLGATESNNGDVVGAHQHGIYEAYTDTAFNQEAWILKIDGSGNIIWSKCFGGSGESYLSGALENNGGILLTGFTNSKDGDLPYYPEAAVPLWILQISNTGNIIASKLHKLYKGYQDTNYVAINDGFYENIMGSSLHKTRDGNFIVGGSIADKYGIIRGKHGSSDFLVVKINPVGDIIWQKATGGTDYDYINDIIVDKNDDIVFVGSSLSDNDDLYQHNSPYVQSLVVGKLGITNIIKGQVFIDNNNNHIKDAGEQYYSQGRINSVKATDTIAGRIFDGRFLNNVDTGNYVSSYQPANNYYTVFPATHNTGFTSFDLKDSVDFALSPKPGINDLEVQLLPLSTPRPGFDVTYRIITKNVGTTTINNVRVGLKTDSRQTYLDASRPEDGELTDSIWWGPFTLNAFDIDTLYATLTLDAPPLLNNGDTLSLKVTANPVLNDSSAANNIFAIKELVRGSFDPNDKTEIHAGTLTTTQYASGEYLQYLIRFQNTGTDTAFFVTVKDTLQSRLDLGSLEIISASHPYIFKSSGNVVSWDFKKILLPDSTTDEAGSHGFIVFKIKPKTGLTVGDEFINKAAIYFDYNLPVITNQDKTAIGANSAICPTGNATFNAGISGFGYQWQVDNGTGFTNLSNAGFYSGVNTQVLLLTAPPTSMRGYRYRCVVNGITNGPAYKLAFAVQWKGTAGTAWENTANWDCGVLPDAQTAVIIPAGASYPMLSSNAACYSLRLSAGSTVTVKNGFKLTIIGKAD